jgi:hypothetical protein
VSPLRERGRISNNAILSNSDNLNLSTAAAVVHERTRLLAASSGNSRSASNNTSHNGTPTSSIATAKHRYYGKQLSQGKWQQHQ